MKSLLSKAKQKLTFLGAVTISVLIGGLTSAVVLASIPDNQGLIHTCYKPTNGTLAVVDSPTKTCGAGQTALNWSQGGGVVHDSNNQTIGDLVNANNVPDPGITVYNHVLDRTVYVNSDASKFGTDTIAWYESSDCTGQGYVPAGTSPVSIKTSLFRITTPAVDNHFIVQSTANPVTADIKSIVYWTGQQQVCDAVAYGPQNVYAFIPVSLPFTTPVGLPFKF